MKRVDTKKGLAILTVAAMLFAMSACGKKDSSKTAESKSSGITTPTTTEPTTTPSTETTPSLTIISGPLENNLEITWTETPFETAKTVYCAASDGYVNVRKGPNSDTYEIVGKINKGQAVTVVATTDNGWYKTADGFYISQQFFTESAPQ